ncbi:DUF2867 domain-containing protein [Streptomyces boninensis]|uniref:DUF2867 domain-containing protein n=1 Tax=Streptomyces boninensis TaxID=2039455 RepID=UPI003B21FE14
MRLPKSAHAELPWRIHELAPDFGIEDVWALPTPGGADEFPSLLSQLELCDFPDRDAPFLVRFLWAARWKIGGVLGWDREEKGPAMAGVPFEPLYATDKEFVAEMANQTVHTLMHMGWVPDGKGGYRGQMTALVKPNGLLGKAYMTAVKPFRYVLVYPALMRNMESNWRVRAQAGP